MRFSVKAHHLPQRVATGAFILNSGIGKLRADEEAAAQLHGFAAGAYPFLARLKPADFVRLLAVSENGDVLMSTDLVTFSCIGKAPPDVRSVGSMGGRVYFGAAQGRVYAYPRPSW